MKFIAMVCETFLARQRPVSTIAKPACMNMTRKPVTSVQVMLIATRLWPTALASFSASGSFLICSVYSSKAFFFSSHAFLASANSFASVIFFGSGASPGSATGNAVPLASIAVFSSPVAVPAGSPLGPVSAGAAGAAGAAAAGVSAGLGVSCLGASAGLGASAAGFASSFSPAR